MIPSWDNRGLIPPTLSAAGFDRSPYRVSVCDLIERFGPISAERRVILEGFLDFREAVHQAGATSGFQWLDGSFLEDVETSESRSPNDIDVVTFVANTIGVDLNAADFHPPGSKMRFKVDSYFLELSATPPKNLVAVSTYWYSMWSHRRDLSWKGFFELDLDPGDDKKARTLLDGLKS